MKKQNSNELITTQNGNVSGTQFDLGVIGFYFDLVKIAKQQEPKGGRTVPDGIQIQ